MPSPKPLTSVTAHIDAPIDTVADLVLSLTPGSLTQTNGWLITQRFPNMALTAARTGEGRFAINGLGSTLTAHIDRRTRALSLQGGWWYRGAYAVEAAEGDQMTLTHTVCNFARTGTRWLVPFANRFFIGLTEQTQHELDQVAQALRHQLGDSKGRAYTP